MKTPKDKDQSWDYKAIKYDGGMAYGYTADFKRTQSKLKYDRVRGLMKKIPTIRKAWLAKVNKFDVEDKNSVAAVVLEILYSFAARVGSAPGRGVGTLIARQASYTQQGINLAYLGKDSIPTKHILKETDPIQKKIVEALRILLEEKKGNEFIFTYEVKGKLRRCSPADVNAAFRAFGAPDELSVHKLRTIRGTGLFLDLMAKDAERRPPKDEKEALARYLKMTEEVGKLLNHKRGVGGSNEKVTGTTAAQSYIDGAAQLDLWSRWDFRPPKVLEKLMRSEEE
jgi:DNA topoisomerase IB